MKQYLNLLQHTLDNGLHSVDRTGVGTIGVFAANMRFNLPYGFPACTTKKLAWKSVVGELLWFIEGSQSLERLSELTYGVKDRTTIWHANVESPHWATTEAGQLKNAGRIYGVQWRNYRGADGSTVDQLTNLIHDLKNNPESRRHILSAWNPVELNDMCLPPCHVLAQFYVRNNTLSCQMYQRSQDLYLGGPFNIASYALLTHMIAQVCGLLVGELSIIIGDAHIYSNHIAQVKELLTRTPFPLPSLWLNPDITDIEKFTMNDIKLINYQSHGALPAPMAV